MCREKSVGKLAEFEGRITTVPGTTDDREVIERAVAGCDGVLVVLVPRGVHGYATGTAQAVLDHAEPGARLVFSCGWHITRDGQDVYSRRLKAIVDIFGPLARLPASPTSTIRWRRADASSPATPVGPSCVAATSRRATARACRCGAATSATASSRATSRAASTSRCSWPRPSRTTICARSARHRQPSEPVGARRRGKLKPPPSDSAAAFSGGGLAALHGKQQRFVRVTRARASRPQPKPPLPRLAQPPLCPYLAAARRQADDPDRAIILA